MPDQSTRRCVWFTDSQWQKADILAKRLNMTISAVIRASLDATLAGFAERDVLLNTEFSSVDRKYDPFSVVPVRQFEYSQSD
jgi:hypothetical protein